jgi:superfamily II DNA or RNA helicase
VRSSTSEKLSPAFDSGAKRCGAALLRKRAVRLRASGHEEARAIVWAEERVAVLVRLVGPAAVVAHCTCTEFEATGVPCAHLWAVLLEIDRANALPALARARRLSLHELDPIDDIDEITSLHELAVGLDDGGDEELGVEDVDAYVVPAPPPRPRAPPVDWCWMIARARSERAVGELPRQMDRRYRREHGYRIDLPRTLREAVEGLAIEVMGRTVGPSSPDPKWKPAEITPHDIVGAVDERDRKIFRVLAAGHPMTYGEPLGPVVRTTAPRLWSSLVAPIGETGHGEVVVDEGRAPEPLVVDHGGPFRLVLVVEETKRTMTVRGELRRGGEAIDLASLSAILDGDVAFLGARAIEIDRRVPWAWVEALRAHHVLRARGADRGEVLRGLVETCAMDAIDWKEPFVREESPAGGPHVHLRLTADRYGGKSAPLHVAVTFDYGGARAPFGSHGDAVDLEGRRFVVRDREGERRVLVELASVGVYMQGRLGEGERLALAAAKLVGAVEALPPERYTIEADGLVFRRPSSFAMTVTSGIDWFSLDAKVAFDDDEVELPAILAALRRGERTVRLGKGGVGLLPEAWLARLGRVMELSSGGDLRFSRTQIALVEALLADDRETVRWEGPVRALREQIDALTRPSALERFAPPRTFTGTLRRYQAEGASWLRALEEAGFGGCLADDMGLGKTVQVLAHLAERTAKGRARGPSLVVAPRSVVHNWIEEARRFTPSLRVVELGRDTPLEGVDLAVTSYGVMREQIPRLSRIELDYLVLDEAHAIKNPDAATTKAARLLRARARLAMTGTPVENRLGDLVSLFDFLNPGMLGPSLKKNAKRWSVEATGAAASLGRGLRPFLLRRTKAEVLAELPPRIEQTIPCALGKKQRAVYDEVKRYYQATLLARVRERGVASESMNVLEALLRLRQIACHPGLVDRASAHDESAKLSTLVDHLVPVVEQGKKALVFSQFTSLLDIVERELDARGIAHTRLDGSTRDRKERVARFQDDAGCGVFLISLKAGGVGLNLTAAEYVFLLDPWWNPAAEAQAIDRAHRIGQKRSVVAYRLLAKDTVEDRVAELQAKKRALVASVFEGGSGVSLGKLSVNDVEALLA